MPTILDELVVKLGLDSAGFRRDADATQAVVAKTGAAARRYGRELEEAAEKTQHAHAARMSQIEAVGRSVTHGFTRMRNEVLGLLATITGAVGLQQFVRAVTQTNVAMGYAAKSIGMSVGELNAWDEAGKRVGGTGGEVVAALQGVSAELQQFQLSHQSVLIEVNNLLRAMPGRMIDVADATGKAIDASEYLLALHDRFSKMPLPQALAIGAKIPGMNETTVRLLSRPDFAQILAERRKLGVITPADFEAADRARNAISDVQQAVTKLGNTIVTDFNKDIVGFIESIRDWVTEFRNAPGAIQGVEDKIKEFVAVVKGIGTSIAGVIGTFDDWIKVLGKIPKLFESWTSIAAYIAGPFAIAIMAGLSPVTAAIAAIAAGIVLIKTSLEPFDPKNYTPGSPFWHDMPEEEQLLYPQSPASRRKSGGGNPNPFHWYNPGSWLGRSPEETEGAGPRLAPGAYGNSPTDQTLDKLMMRESSGRDVINFRNKEDPSYYTAGGYYQIVDSTWRRAAQWAGVDVNQYPRALHSPPEIQRRVARALYEHEGEKPWAESAPNGPQNPLAFGPRIPPVGPTFGPQMAPQSALDPGMRYAMRPAGASVNNSRSSTSSVETHINGPINVQTSATDADGIARGIGDALREKAFVWQSNYGLA